MPTIQADKHGVTIHLKFSTLIKIERKFHTNRVHLFDAYIIHTYVNADDGVLRG